MGEEETNRNRRKNKIKKQGAGPPTQAVDASMGEEEKNRKQKEEQKKDKGSGALIQLPGPFGRLLRPAWIIQWAYCEKPTPTGGGFNNGWAN